MTETLNTMANEYKDMNLVKGFFVALRSRWQMFDSQHPTFASHLYFALVFLGAMMVVGL